MGTFTASCLAAYLMDRLGRRSLLIVSFTGMVSKIFDLYERYFCTLVEHRLLKKIRYLQIYCPVMQAFAMAMQVLVAVVPALSSMRGSMALVGTLV